MARPIKVVREELVKEAAERYKLGVPVIKILKDLDINLSNYSLVKLLANYTLAIRHNNNAVYKAIFPDFIDDPRHTKRDGNVVIQDKETHEFDGFFPFGVWIDKRK